MSRSKEAKASIRRRRRQRAAFRLNNFFAWVLAVVLLGMVNYLSYRYYWRADISESQFYALSEKTETVLAGLENDVWIKVFFSPTHDYFEHVTNLLKEYTYRSDKVHVEYIDPHLDPARVRELASRYELPSENVIVVAAEDAHTVIDERDLVKFEYDVITIPPEPSAVYFRGETALSSAIRGVVNPDLPRVYFLQGHDEQDLQDFDEYTGYSGIADAMLDDNIDLHPLVIGEATAIPDDADALIIAGPARRISQPELDIIRFYLEQSGRILMLVDPLRGVGLETILSDWGVVLSKDLVLDATRTLSGNEIVVTEYGEHPITRSLNQTSTSFILARSVEPVGEVDVEGRQVDQPRAAVLASTSEAGWAELTFDQTPARFDPATDRPGPISIAVAVEKGVPANLGTQIPPTRMVVIGDSDFVSNGYLSGGNQAFFLSSLNWLVERESMMAIDPKLFEETRLMITRDQLQLLFLSTAIGIPAVVSIIGLLVWVRRRA